MGAFADALKERNKDRESGGFAAELRRRRGEADPEASILNQPTLDRSGMSSPAIRFSLAGGDTLEEKNRIFKQYHPNGVIERVPGTGTLVFKQNIDDPNQRFKTVERENGAATVFDPSSVGASFKEAGKDVFEFIGANKGPILGEISATLMPWMRGARLMKSSVTEGAGAFTGELAEQGVQIAQGVNTQDLPSVFSQAATEGGGAAIGSGLFQVAAKPLLNVGRGAGLLKEKPGGVEAEQARQFLNTQLPKDKQIPPFTAGQVAETPVFARLDEQSIALAGGLREQRRLQIAGVSNVARKAADSRALIRGRNSAANALESENRKLITAINGRGDFEQTGVALNEALTNYSRNSQKQIVGLYGDAAELAPRTGDPQFDLGVSLAAATELERGVRAVGKQRTVTPEDGLSDLDRLSKTGAIDKTSTPTIDAQGSLDPALQSVINDLRAIDPTFPGGEKIAPSWMVLDNLRQRLFDLKTPNPGEALRRSHRHATVLYNAITDTLDAPIGGDDAFKKAWNVARQKASDRFSKLELSNIVRLAKTDATTEFAQHLAQPGSSDALRQLGSTLDAKTMRQVTDTFKNDMASDLGNFTVKLKAFDKETLRRLLSPDEIKQFNVISTKLQQLASSGVEKAIERQTRSRLFVRDLINRDDSAGVSALLDIVRNNGGRNGPLGSSVRAGIIDDFFEEVTTIQVGGGKIPIELLNNRLKKLQNLGLGPLLTAKDRRLMRSVFQIAPFIKLSRGGAGASIQAADVGENLISFGDPKSQISGMFSIIQKIGYARAMQNPAVHRFLIGHGREAADPRRTLAVMGAALTTGLTELEKEESE